MTGAVAADLIAAFGAAYRPYVLARIEELGLPAPPGLEAALEEGMAWLGGELAALLALPFAAQRRSPLEVFQEALRFPTAVMQEAGVAPASRDPAAEAALPGDTHHLAPASSQALGADAWSAHLAWGAAKAAAMTAPFALYVGSNLMDRATIEGSVRAAGLVLEGAGSGEAVRSRLQQGRPLLAMVDLTHPAAEGALRLLGDAAVHTVAFGPHVDDVMLAGARALGATAMARSRFFRSLPELLPKRA